MNKVLVIAPHPDDETLGCGGSLLRHRKNGDDLYWVICTGMKEKEGWSTQQVKKRNNEIKTVRETYKFKEIFRLNYPATKIDTFPISDLIGKIGDIFNNVSPEILYMPFTHDVHTDHQFIASAVQSAVKWFRCPSIQRVLMYETLSETEFNYVGDKIFRPNVFVNISEFLNDKIAIMKLYASELGKHPFPRSEKTIKALAALRGSQCGCESAEAFQLIMERQLL